MLYLLADLQTPRIDRRKSKIYNQYGQQKQTYILINSIIISSFNSIYILRRRTLYRHIQSSSIINDFNLIPYSDSFHKRDKYYRHGHIHLTLFAPYQLRYA